MDGHVVDLGSFGPGGAGAADSQVREAGQWHRIAAGAVTAIVAIGGPVGALLIGVPTLLPFVELVVLVVPILMLSTAARVMVRWATVTADGTRVTPGQLVTGLRPVRGASGPRLVRIADSPDLAFDPKRVVVGTAAFGLTGLITFVLVTGSAWLAYNVVFQEQIAARQEAAWAADEPRAAAVKDAFVAELLAGRERAGERYVTGQAQVALGEYRSHLRADGVTALELEGNGTGGGQYEYTLREVSPTSLGRAYAQTVSLQLEERDGQMLITEIVRN